MTFKATLICAALAASPAMSEATMFEDFSADPNTRWDYVSDQVMGGVSEGQATVANDGDTRFIRLTGDVSTDNNGGFIQVRRLLNGDMPADMTGLKIKTRGNGQEYYVHIRTKDSNIPWFYYQATFTAPKDWGDVSIPLDAFKPSNTSLPTMIEPGKITSLGIVAYGRDHAADVSVAGIEVF